MLVQRGQAGVSLALEPRLARCFTEVDGRQVRWHPHSQAQAGQRRSAALGPLDERLQLGRRRPGGGAVAPDVDIAVLDLVGLLPDAGQGVSRLRSGDLDDENGLAVDPDPVRRPGRGLGSQVVVHPGLEFGAIHRLHARDSARLGADDHERAPLAEAPRKVGRAVREADDAPGDARLPAAVLRSSCPFHSSHRLLSVGSASRTAATSSASRPAPSGARVVSKFNVTALRLHVRVEGPPRSGRSHRAGCSVCASGPTWRRNNAWQVRERSPAHPLSPAATDWCGGTGAGIARHGRCFSRSAA